MAIDSMHIEFSAFFSHWHARGKWTEQNSDELRTKKNIKQKQRKKSDGLFVSVLICLKSVDNTIYIIRNGIIIKRSWSLPTFLSISLLLFAFVSSDSDSERFHLPLHTLSSAIVWNDDQSFNLYAPNSNVNERTWHMRFFQMNATFSWKINYKTSAKDTKFLNSFEESNRIVCIVFADVSALPRSVSKVESRSLISCRIKLNWNALKFSWFVRQQCGSKTPRTHGTQPWFVMTFQMLVYNLLWLKSHARISINAIELWLLNDLRIIWKI